MRRVFRMQDFEALTAPLLERQNESAGPARTYTTTDSMLQAALALQRLSPARRDEYSEWVSVGLALKTSLGESVGFTLWRDWSAGSPKYDEQECEKKWASLPQHSDLTVASLVYWAREDSPA